MTDAEYYVNSLKLMRKGSNAPIIEGLIGGFKAVMEAKGVEVKDDGGDPDPYAMIKETFRRSNLSVDDGIARFAKDISNLPDTDKQYKATVGLLKFAAQNASYADECKSALAFVKDATKEEAEEILPDIQELLGAGSAAMEPVGADAD